MRAWALDQDTKSNFRLLLYLLVLGEQKEQSHAGKRSSTNLRDSGVRFFESKSDVDFPTACKMMAEN